MMCISKRRSIEKKRGERNSRNESSDKTNQININLNFKVVQNSFLFFAIKILSGFRWIPGLTIYRLFRKKKTKKKRLHSAVYDQNRISHNIPLIV